MAEALLKKKLEKNKISNINVASCGLKVHRDSIHPNLQSLLGDARVHLERIKPRPISEAIVMQADLILAMEERQVREVLSRFPLAEGKLTTVAHFAEEKDDVRDFIDTGPDAFRDWMKDCLVALERMTDRIVNEDLVYRYVRSRS